MGQPRNRAPLFRSLPPGPGEKMEEDDGLPGDCRRAAGDRRRRPLRVALRRRRGHQRGGIAGKLNPMSTSRSAAAALAFVALSASSVLRAGTLPRPASEFTIHLPGGRQVLLSQYKGKTVALIFILTYCPHCQKI